MEDGGCAEAELFTPARPGLGTARTRFDGIAFRGASFELLDAIVRVWQNYLHRTSYLVVDPSFSSAIDVGPLRPGRYLFGEVITTVNGDGGTT
jgi:hypothetical protein